MHVLLIVNTFPSREHPYITEWVASLQRLEVETTVLCEKMPDRTTVSTADRVKIFFLNQLNGSALKQWRNLARFPGALISGAKVHRAWNILRVKEKKRRTALRKLYEYLPWLDLKVDLVHFNAPQIAVRRFELGELFNAPVLVSFRGQDMTFFPDRYDQILQKADHLHFISRHLLDEAMNRGYKGEKQSIIPPIVDTSFYCPLHASNTERVGSEYILFSAARLEWSKGFEYTIQAVSILSQRGWRLKYLIAGDGSLRTAIEYAARQLKVEDKVQFLGWQQPIEIRACLQKSDIYLLGSVEEGFNNSVLQAQACGIPVVCTDVGGLPENIEDGVTGLLARCRDPWDMADKIEALLQDKYSRINMGINGRKRVLQKFNLEDNTVRFVNMYQSILDNR